MATFEAQVVGLTGLTIDDSSSPTRAELNQFLSDGAKEVLNALPRAKQEMFTTSNDLNSSSVNLTLLGSEVFSVTRDDGTINQPCRRIPARLNGRVRDSDDMMAATATDPVYYIVNNILSVVPEPSNSNNAHVHTLAYPTVSYTHEVIAKFPDDGEYLVPLYASVKSLQNVLGSLSVSNTDINNALTAIKTAVEQARDAADKFEVANTASVFGDTATFDATNSQLTRVKDAVDKVSDIVNGDQPSATTDAFGAQANEDIELVSSALNIAQTELSRAQMHLSEWNAIGDMRVKEVNSALSEASGFANEMQARITANLDRYNKYEKQQAKLQADYEKGLAQLVR